MYLFAQSHEGIIGHWKLCDNIGYSECIIGDVTLDWLFPGALNMVGTRFTYNVVNDTIVCSDGFTHDSIYFDIIDQDHIVLAQKKVVFTLERIKSDQLNFYNFDCSFKMSYVDYLDMLDNHLRERMKLDNEFCPKVKNENAKTLVEYDDDHMEEEFLDFSDSLPSVRASAYLSNTKILETDINDNFKSKIISITYNPDSSKANIVFDALQYCYASHNTRAFLNNNSDLEIQFRTIESICKEKCKMRFEMKVKLRNYIIEDVIFRDE